jgi:uncharacterized protein (DUF58 family)
MNPINDSVAAQHRAEQLASRFPPLLVAAERVAATVAQGVHGRRRVGQGETFWQFRRYQPGDQTSAIDWRQSAKSRFVFVRETEWEAAQSAWLWRDASPSMGYKSSRDLPSKLERAELLLIALASLLTRGGERFTMLGGGFPPATGRAAFSRLSAAVLNGAMASATGDDQGLPPYERLPRYAQVVLLSDFLFPLDAIGTVLARLADRGVQGHLMQILDPAEAELPFKGRIRFDGLENEGNALFDRAETVRPDYHRRLEAHQEALATMTRRMDWRFTFHRTDHSAESALLSLYSALAALPGR